MNQKSIFNSYNSKVIKGLAITLMLIYHLFAFNFILNSINKLILYKKRYTIVN